MASNVVQNQKNELRDKQDEINMLSFQLEDCRRRARAAQLNVSCVQESLGAAMSVVETLPDVPQQSSLTCLLSDCLDQLQEDGMP